jgi:hypothetical protein
MYCRTSEGKIQDSYVNVEYFAEKNQRNKEIAKEQQIRI